MKDEMTGFEDGLIKLSSLECSPLSIFFYISCKNYLSADINNTSQHIMTHDRQNNIVILKISTKHVIKLSNIELISHPISKVCLF